MTTVESGTAPMDAIDCTIHVGCGNVFADMGLPDPELCLIKALVSMLIEHKIKALGLSRAGAAARLGLSQADLSKIIQGRCKDFDLYRLRDALAVLDSDVPADDEFCAGVREELVRAEAEVMRVSEAALAELVAQAQELDMGY